jgi:hypothetical protein
MTDTERIITDSTHHEMIMADTTKRIMTATIGRIMNDTTKKIITDTTHR